MKISIITVCLNAERSIERTIKSVLSQSYENIEYIIIDGGSQDSTNDIISAHTSDLGYYITEKDDGVYDAMNKGARVATGDIIYFINSDDVFYNNQVVSKVVECFHNCGSDIVYGDVIFDDDCRGISFIKSHSDIDKMYFADNMICHQAIFMKKALFERCGFYDKSFKIAGDFDWLLRVLWQYKVTSYHIDCIVAFYNANGISANPKYNNILAEERLKVIKHNFNYFETAIYNRHLLPYLARHPKLKRIFSLFLKWDFL